MKKTLIVLIAFSALSFSSFINCFAESSLPKKKQTTLELYLTTQEAFEKWRANPEKIKILDVRTPGEYIFVGHAPMAVNIPIKFLDTKFDHKKKNPVMRVNKEFVDEVEKRFSKTDTLFILCRSGSRSALAINTLAEAGFKNSYNICDGFEGDKLKLPGSDNDGKRVVNGWKNAGLPWTYKVDPKLMYVH